MSRRDGGAGPRRPDGGRPGRPAEPTVLLSARDDRLSRTIPVELLCERVRPDDAVVAVTLRDAPSAVATRLTERVEAVGSGSLSMVAAVEDTDPGATVVDRSVGRDPEPATLAAAVEAAVDDRPADRVHLLVDGFTAPADGGVEPVYRRAHEVAMAVGAEPGLGLFTADAVGLSAAFVQRLAHLVDVHVSLREQGGRREACWTSLTDASDGWRRWSDVEFAQVGRV
jgi:hypothetical protein